MRPRGLCNSCYVNPDIRHRYPRFVERGVNVEGTGHILPAAEPTDALPGTKAKVRVMAARALAGQAIFHPQDARLPKHGE
jgi:hypothetical protein